jgi:hypothetical protein
MSTAWVAGSVRARAMSRRRLGTALARELASRPSLDSAIDVLATSPYGHDVHPGQALDAAQHAVASTVLWHMRVMAGWVPRGDARILRVMAGGFEIANVDELLRELAGLPAEPAFRLGTLSTAWPALAPVSSVADLREALARSAWGDPGADSPEAIRLAMRLAWAVRVAASIPLARPWASGAAAVIAARTVLLDRRPPSGAAARLATSLLGSRWTEATTMSALAGALPAEARWVVDHVDDPADLWQAEARWWGRVDADGRALLHRPVTTPDPVIGSVAVLAVDAWRTRAALEVAARGGAGAPAALEAFDVVA